ncbi:MAG: chemotaxis protein CheB, partial [Sphingomonadaceae bacterium]|nr:chemotaxis protein CheB [Sphingomonadaceae bacterium]
NHIYVAPGHAHLVCRRERGKIVIDYQTHYAQSRYCPSVDAMFESVASLYGADGMAVVLSGMGNDGVIGARAVSDAGGSVLVQDMESSVVWGMPGAVAREHLATAILAPAQMTEVLGRIVKLA